MGYRESYTIEHLGKNWWIKRDRLGKHQADHIGNENEFVWFLYSETTDVERKNWSGWKSQWDLAGIFKTENEALKYLKNSKNIFLKSLIDSGVLK